MNPKTPDGVPEKEWAKVTKLALAAAAASGKADDAAAADGIFSTLMGEDVESRRNFIQKNAKDVRFLDI